MSIVGEIKHCEFCKAIINEPTEFNYHADCKYVMDHEEVAVEQINKMLNYEDMIDGIHWNAAAIRQAVYAMAQFEDQHIMDILNRNVEPVDETEIPVYPATLDRLLDLKEFQVMPNGWSIGSTTHIALTPRMHGKSFVARRIRDIMNQYHVKECYVDTDTATMHLTLEVEKPIPIDFIHLGITFDDVYGESVIEGELKKTYINKKLLFQAMAKGKPKKRKLSLLEKKRKKDEKKLRKARWQ